MKTTLLTIFSLSIICNLSIGQQNYDDFDGNKFQIFGQYNGTLDSTFINPGADTINSSLMCAKYDRADSVQYDNIRLYPITKLVDVTPYATNLGSPPKIKMMLYTTAPVGTKVEIQLGIKSDNNYPSGVHSIYRDSTTTQNEWEELVFDFVQIPPGALVGPTQVDKITLFFSPFSFNNDVYYFDDLTGPNLYSAINVEVVTPIENYFLDQNFPNPAFNKTTINYSLPFKGHVSLKLYDCLGKKVSTLVDQNQDSGEYKFKLNTADLSGGNYFYVLQVGEFIETKRMTILKL